jgi:hypothetical protein
MDAVLREFVR